MESRFFTTLSLVMLLLIAALISPLAFSDGGAMLASIVETFGR